VVKSDLTKRPHHWCTCMVQSRSPGGANVHPRSNTCFLGPPESTTQTASRSVQPFLHSSQQKVPTLYNGPPLSPQNCPLA